MNRLSKSELKEMFIKNENVSLVEENSPQFVTNGASDNLVVWFKNVQSKKRVMRAGRKVNSSKNYLNFKKWSKLSGEELFVNILVNCVGHNNLNGLMFGGPLDKNKGNGGPLVLQYY